MSQSPRRITSFQRRSLSFSGNARTCHSHGCSPCLGSLFSLVGLRMLCTSGRSRPDYWAEGLVKAGTAVLSLSTGLLLFPLLPKAMALRSPTELEQLNGELRRALEDRQQAIERLQQSEAALRDRTE